MKNRNIGNNIIQGMNEAIEYVRGQKEGAVTHEIKVPDNIDVAKIRKNMRLTRIRFAERFGFNPKAVQNWEQGVRRPTRSARILLCILEKEPDIVNKSWNPLNAKKEHGWW